MESICRDLFLCCYDLKEHATENGSFKNLWIVTTKDAEELVLELLGGRGEYRVVYSQNLRVVNYDYG